MRISVRVKPNSRKAQVVALDDGTFRVFVKAPPIEGRANEELVELLSEHFRCPKRNVNILRGSKGRQKFIEIVS